VDVTLGAVARADGMNLLFEFLLYAPFYGGHCSAHCFFEKVSMVPQLFLEFEAPSNFSNTVIFQSWSGATNGLGKVWGNNL